MILRIGLALPIGASQPDVRAQDTASENAPVPTIRAKPTNREVKRGMRRFAATNPHNLFPRSAWEQFPLALCANLIARTIAEILTNRRRALCHSLIFG
jgi:hypothetical protein